MKGFNREIRKGHLDNMTFKQRLERREREESETAGMIIQAVKM